MKAYIMGSNLKRSLKRGEGRDWSFFQLKLSNSQPEIENGVAYKRKCVLITYGQYGNRNVVLRKKTRVHKQFFSVSYTPGWFLPFQYSESLWK